MSERSKFCPRCGKASPQRHRQAAIATEEPPATAPKSRIDAAKTASTDAPANSFGARSPDYSSAEALRQAGVRTGEGLDRAAGGPARLRSDGARRVAPQTRAMAAQFEQAGFGLRYGAWMFDFLIILIAMMGFTFAVSAASRRSVIGSDSDLLMVGGLTLLLFVVNFVVLAGMSGQSLGMRILGIYIVRVDGKPFTTKDAALRHLVGYPLSMVVAFLGFLWMLWDRRQQGWHDKIARTMVVMSK